MIDRYWCWTQALNKPVSLLERWMRGEWTKRRRRLSSGLLHVGTHFPTILVLVLVLVLVMLLMHAVLQFSM
jgi:hypothetical protein